MTGTLEDNAVDWGAEAALPGCRGGTTGGEGNTAGDESTGRASSGKADDELERFSELVASRAFDKGETVELDSIGAAQRRASSVWGDGALDFEAAVEEDMMPLLKAARGSHFLRCIGPSCRPRRGPATGAKAVVAVGERAWVPGGGDAVADGGGDAATP